MRIHRDQHAHLRAEACVLRHPQREQRRDARALWLLLSDYETSAFDDSPPACNRIRLKSAAKPSYPDRASRSA
jgi:hypothetical protein